MGHALINDPDKIFFAQLGGRGGGGLSAGRIRYRVTAQVGWHVSDYVYGDDELSCEIYKHYRVSLFGWQFENKLFSLLRL